MQPIKMFNNWMNLNYEKQIKLVEVYGNGDILCFGFLDDDIRPTNDR